MNKISDTTQFALIGKDISQLQKDVTSIVSDMKEMRLKDYVTKADLTEKIKEVIEKNNNELRGIKTILGVVGSALTVAIVSAIMKQILLP